VKILIHSNAPAPLSYTGYGVQVGLLAPRLAAAGHDVVVSCMTGIAGFPTTWEGIQLLPAGLTAYSGDILQEHARRFFGHGPGLVLIHYDAWAIGAGAVDGLATAAWTPVHSDVMSQGDRVFYAASGAHPIAYSRHAERAMIAAGLSPSYVPHGVDTAAYAPLERAERIEARRYLNVPADAFVIAVVGANKGYDPPRKGWGELFHGFAAFRRKHPDALLLIHSLPCTPEGWGIDMRPLIASLGLGDAVIFSDDYRQVAGLYGPAYMRKLYGCADVLINPSWGEGFGLAPLEAQACGTPVIVGDNSAQPELCASGWKVACQPYWHYRDLANWACPSIKSVTACLGKAYAARGDERQREKARELALRFDADLVFTQHWKPTLEMLEQMAGAARVRLPRNGTSVPLPTVSADGLRWLARGPHTDDWISVAHEDALAPVLDSLMPEGGVLLDVGAHVGRWSLRLAGKASKVYAVEANPDTAACLRYHIAINEVTNVTVIEAAAWDCHDRLVMDDPNDKVTGGSTRMLEPGDAGGDVLRPVEAWPLDTLLLDEEAPERVDLIKLDVEGADLQALEGMAQILGRYRPVLFIEDHSIYGYYAHADLVGWLESHGYDAQPFIASLAGDRQAPYVIARPAAGGAGDG
jgi:FkbM family methyltransferase